MEHDELLDAVCTTVEPFHFEEIQLEPAILEAVGPSAPEWYWKPGSTLKVHFLDGDEALKRKVAEIAEEWTEYANLKFRFYFDKAPFRYRYIKLPFSDKRQRFPVGLATDIAITFWDKGGGQSQIGTYSRTMSRIGRPSMSLPKSGNRRVVLHEFGHALGLRHEHQNPQGKIQWNKSAVYAYYKKHHDWDKDKVDHNVLKKLDKNSTISTKFDKHSIMLYPIPASLTANGFSTTFNQNISKTDQEFIARAYP